MNRAYLGLIISIILWATTFSFIKWSVPYLPPISLALFRFVLASITLVIIILIKKEGKQFLSALNNDIYFFALLGLFGIAIMYIFNNLAIYFTTTSEAAIIMNSDPLIIAVFAYFFLGEKWSLTKSIGLTLGFIGVILVVFHNLDIPTALASQSLLGNIFAFGSSIAWAIYTAMIKKKVKQYGTLVITTISSIFGAIFLFIFAVIFEDVPSATSFSLPLWLIIFYLGVVVSGGAFLLWNYALSYLDASKVGMYWFLVPVIAVVMGIFLFKEVITLLMIIGTILIFIGIYFTEKKTAEGFLWTFLTMSKHILQYV